MNRGELNRLHDMTANDEKIHHKAEDMKNREKDNLHTEGNEAKLDNKVENNKPKKEYKLKDLGEHALKDAWEDWKNFPIA
jgi:hypothetical protein